jgi:hypothetical protein
MRACLLLCLSLLAVGCAGPAAAPRPSTSAPRYPLSHEERIEVERIDYDLARGRQAPYLSVDHPALVSHFLRATCAPWHDEAGRQAYNIHMGRLIDRFNGTTDWSDPRLDWDVWNAWLQIEHIPQDELPYHSAWQLVLLHLFRNADAIAANRTRGRWWLDEIMNGSRSPARAALVLFLASCLDKRSIELTQKLYADAVASSEGSPVFRSYYRTTPAAPLVLVDGDELPVPMRSFNGAMDALAGSLGYRWQAWGFDAHDLPSPHVANPRDAKRPSLSGGPVPMLSQGSWAPNGKASCQLTAFDYFGQPDDWQPRINVVPPTRGRVVLYANDGFLLCWPRLATPDAALKVAARAGLLSGADLPDFYARGYRPLKVTVSSR